MAVSILTRPTPSRPLGAALLHLFGLIRDEAAARRDARLAAAGIARLDARLAADIGVAPAPGADPWENLPTNPFLIRRP